MPISLCHVGDNVLIRKIKGKDEIAVHLKNLGFVEGSNVTVMNKSGDSIILQVKEARIAIDSTMAKRILV